MAGSPLVRKLGIKPGHRVLIMNAARNYSETLGDLPDEVKIETEADGVFDFIQVFVRNKADIDSHSPTAIRALAPGGMLWFSYPKRSSKVATDVTRDVGWESLGNANMRPVSQVSIDTTWSALRFRPIADVKPRNRP